MCDVLLYYRRGSYSYIWPVIPRPVSSPGGCSLQRHENRPEHHPRGGSKNDETSQQEQGHAAANASTCLARATAAGSCTPWPAFSSTHALAFSSTASACGVVMEPHQWSQRQRHATKPKRRQVCHGSEYGKVATGWPATQSFQQPSTDQSSVTAGVTEEVAPNDTKTAV